MITSKDAKTILEGIAGLACRMSKSDESHYRIKAGGDVNAGRALIDWYLTVQNIRARNPGDADPQINSNAAQSGGLHRLSFNIYQASGASEASLRISEWKADEDWLGQPRVIWSAEVTMASRTELAKKMAAAIEGFRD